MFRSLSPKTALALSARGACLIFLEWNLPSSFLWFLVLFIFSPIMFLLLLQQQFMINISISNCSLIIHILFTLQFRAAVGAIWKIRRYIAPAVRAVLIGWMIGNRPKMLISYFSIIGIFFKFPSDNWIQLKKAATAGAFDKISYIPLEQRNKKYMKVSVYLADLISG